MRVIVNGAKGRMGQAVISRLQETGHEVVAQVDPSIKPGEGFTDISQVNKAADAIIDFSSPKALDSLLSYAQDKKCPLVLATTGYTLEQLAQIEEASKNCTVFKSANMSLGINVMKKLVAQAAQILGDDFDVEVVETHHNRKKDAPSGTALLLYDAIKDAYDTPRRIQPGRFGSDAMREKNEIGIHAVRGGTVAGTHEVGFYGYNEVITLTHSAQSREIFAIGAVKAAEYLVKIKASDKSGMYSMEDLIG